MADYKEEKYWSRFADTFEEDQRYIVGGAVQEVLKESIAGESGLGELIELGCGTGFFTKSIAACAGHVTATDLSDQMLAIAKTRLKDLQNVTVEKADCEKTGFPDGKFDSVFMANLIHVIEDPDFTLRESYRILKNDGVLIIISYTSEGLNLFKKIPLGIRLLRRWGRPPRGFRSLSPDGLRSLAEKHGFKVEEVKFVGDKSKALYLKGRKTA